MMQVKLFIVKIFVLSVVLMSIFSSGTMAATNTSLSNITSTSGYSSVSSPILNFIQNLTLTFMEIGWGLFGLSWVIGWVLRGSPIHYRFVKETGQRLIDDAIIAGFFLGLGSGVFYLIQWIISQFHITLLILVLHI